MSQQKGSILQDSETPLKIPKIPLERTWRRNKKQFLELTRLVWNTVRKDPLNDLGALMFLKNVLKFGLKNSDE